MRITRVHVEGPLRAGTSVALSAETSRHVLQVLRLRRGDVVHLFDGGGGHFVARLESVERRAVTAQLEEFVRDEAEPPVRIVLAQGISRGQHMDYTVQKAVELGVAEIAPLLTDHGNVKLDASRTVNRLAHWRRIAISACEQCGRNRLPLIHEPQTLEQWTAKSGSGLRILFDAEAETGLTAVSHDGGDITILCGPEGGLAANEIELACAHGYRAVRLGPRVLRTETAAVAAVTACQILWGDLRG